MQNEFELELLKMSYLSDKIVQSVARVTSFMSENLFNANLGTDANDTLNANNTYATSKLISSINTSSPEILIGFDANNILDKLKSSFTKTKEFASNTAQLAQSTGELINFLDKNYSSLYSHLALFTKIINLSASQDINSYNVNNYKYMQNTTNEVIGALSDLILKSTEKSDNLDIIQNKLLCLVNSLTKFVNLYKSLSGLFAKPIETTTDSNSQNDLIGLLAHINANKNIVKKYIDTTSSRINVLKEINTQEINNHLQELSNNNNLFKETCYNFQPSFNWNFIYELSLNIKSDVLDDPYLKFVINKIENKEIEIEKVKQQVNKMNDLYNNHLKIILKYSDKINNIDSANLKRYNLLSKTINNIKSIEERKYSELLCILSLKVSALQIIGSTIKISSSILSLSYDMIKLGNGFQDTFSKINNIVYSGIKSIIKLFIKFIITLLNAIYLIFGNLFALTISLLCYTINSILRASFTLFISTLFPIINMPLYELIIKYILAISKIVNFNFFMLKI